MAGRGRRGLVLLLIGALIIGFCSYYIFTLPSTVNGSAEEAAGQILKPQAAELADVKKLALKEDGVTTRQKEKEHIAQTQKVKEGSAASEQKEFIPPRQNNVLLILVDDLRPQLGCYGTKTLTPNIDKLASRGFRFKYAFNRLTDQAPICSPPRTSLMSGR